MARRLLGAAILSLSLAACSQQSEAARLAILDGVPESHIVGLDDEVVGTRTNGSRMEVVFVYQDSESEWRTDRIASGDFEPGTNSHQLSTGSGLGLNWNTFLYGTAAPEVTEVRVSPLDGARGGKVVDGMWVIASPVECVEIGSLSVEFLDADGSVVDTQ